MSQDIAYWKPFEVEKKLAECFYLVYEYFTAISSKLNFRLVSVMPVFQSQKSLENPPKNTDSMR